MPHAGFLLAPTHPKRIARLNQTLHALADIVFPRTCVHCAGIVDAPDFDYLCAACARELIRAEPPACQTCGYPFWGAMAGPADCPHCAELDPAFDRGKTLFLAKGPGRSLIHEIKYRQGFYVLDDVARLVRTTADHLQFLRGANLVPVPLHPVKHRERGFNQSEIIARCLARAANAGTQVNPVLERIRFTRTQTRLNREQRDRNVKNAFALKPASALNTDQRHILVDDVFTTGATLNACARVLREAGVATVHVLTLGHG